MIVEIFQICKESLNLKENFIRNKELIYLLETRKIEMEALNKYDGVDLNIFFNTFVKKVMSLYPEVLKYKYIIGYLVPVYIKGNDKVCDGFAYISQIPKIIVSNYTDVISVLCHELCHLIVYNIVGKDCMVWKTGEILVELAEYILCKDILPPTFLPTNQEIINLYEQYEKNGVIFKEFLLNLCKCINENPNPSAILRD